MTLPHDATAERCRTAHSSKRSTLVRAEVHADADFADLVDAQIRILLRPRSRRNDLNRFDVSRRGSRLRGRPMRMLAEQFLPRPVENRRADLELALRR